MNGSIFRAHTAMHSVVVFFDYGAIRKEAASAPMIHSLHEVVSCTLSRKLSCLFPNLDINYFDERILIIIECREEEQLLFCYFSSMAY